MSQGPRNDRVARAQKMSPAQQTHAPGAVILRRDRTELEQRIRVSGLALERLGEVALREADLVGFERDRRGGELRTR